MSNPTIVLAVFAVLVAAACRPAPPVIADLEQDKVIIQGGLGTTIESIRAEARRGCAIHDRTPVAINESCLDDYCIRKQYLFACR